MQFFKWNFNVLASPLVVLSSLSFWILLLLFFIAHLTLHNALYKMGWYYYLCLMIFHWWWTRTILYEYIRTKLWFTDIQHKTINNPIRRRKAKNKSSMILIRFNFLIFLVFVLFFLFFLLVEKNYTWIFLNTNTPSLFFYIYFFKFFCIKLL